MSAKWRPVDDVSLQTTSRVIGRLRCVEFGSSSRTIPVDLPDLFAPISHEWGWNGIKLTPSET
jgi:hypothetical protein